MDSELMAYIIAIAVIFLTGPVFITLLALFFFLTYPKDANDDILISDSRKDPTIDRLPNQDTKTRKRRRL